MGRAVLQSHTPTPEQLEEMRSRKDRVASDMRSDVHEAWAMSWLAMHAFDGARSDYSAEKHQEATYIALGYIVSKLEEAKSRYDGDYTGVFRAVMDETGAAP